MLRGKSISVDYAVLMRDLLWWNAPYSFGNKSVQLRWAEDFWRNSKNPENQDKE